MSFKPCRLNAFFAKELIKYQPISEDKKVTLNSLRYRGLDGFVAAVSPFNFTAIGGNLAYTPALMVIISLIIFFLNFIMLLNYISGMFSFMEAIRHSFVIKLGNISNNDRSRSSSWCS